MSRTALKGDNLCPRCGVRERAVSRTGRVMSYCRQCHREVCRQQRLGEAAKKRPAAAVAPAAGLESEGESPAARRRRLEGPGFTALTRGESFAEITGCTERFLLEVACELMDDLGVEEFYQEDLHRAWQEKSFSHE